MVEVTPPRLKKLHAFYGGYVFCWCRPLGKRHSPRCGGRMAQNGTFRCEKAHFSRVANQVLGIAMG